MIKKLKRIRYEGHSRVMAVTGLVPDNWQFVLCQVISKKTDTITIKLERTK